MAKLIQQLSYPRMQTDGERPAAGAIFSWPGFAALGAIRNATIYVDPSIPVEVGERGTSMPFKDFGNALRAAEPGDLMILRPGIYIIDELQQIKKAGLTIKGYGAFFISSVPNSGPMLLITSGNVTIEGIDFDGQRLSGAADTLVGCIRINKAANVTLRDLRIHDQVGYGIEFLDQFDLSIVKNCAIHNCFVGVYASAIIADVIGWDVNDNQVSNCRSGGIIGVGSGDVASFTLRQVRVSRNRMINNEAPLVASSAIAISAAGSDILVSENIISGNHKGVSLYHCAVALVNDNIIKGAVDRGVELTGCLTGQVVGNILDGHVASGNTVMGTGIAITGFYAIANDAGPFLVSGNLILGLNAPGYSMDLANTNNTMIIGNTLTGTNVTIHAVSCFGLQISSNRWDWSGTAPAIQLDAGATRGWSGVTINANRFFPSGAPAAIIVTVDAISTGEAGLTVISNTSPAGKTYTDGTLKKGGTITNLIMAGNVPVATNRAGGVIVGTNGWVNDSTTIVNSDEFNVNTGAAAGGFFFAGLKVVGQRATGWAADTGTSEKTAHAAYVNPTFTDPPTHAEMQALGLAVQNNSRTIVALKNALITHGLLGA